MSQAADAMPPDLPAGPAPRLMALLDRPALLRRARDGLAMSLVINLVALVSPIFLLQVYDRVLTAGSGATLAALTIIAVIALGFGAVFDQARSVAFLRAGARFYADVEPHAFRACHRRALAGGDGRRSQPLDDLATLRTLIGGPLPGAAIDILFAPLFLLALFLIHFWVGLFALATLAVLSAVALLAQWMIAGDMDRSQRAGVAATNMAESYLRAAEASAAMGFVSAAGARWARASREAVAAQISASANAGGLQAAAKGMRAGAQILIIAVAAALALAGGASAGAIIASSVLLARLLAPVDQLLAGWRQLAQGKIALERLEEALGALDAPAPTTGPAPRGRLTLDAIAASNGEGAPILRGISLTLEPGEVLAVIGPVGSGKSTLLRCALGVWPRMSGAARLDGIDLAHAERDAIGPWLGFLPQNADLLPGTIADNIARFSRPDPEAVGKAAEVAGAREVIMRIPGGFDADVGEGGARLSAGQRRRIALARALYKDPVLICLDEPEAHLDRDGELALQRALRALKERGATVLMAAHRPSIAALSDRTLVLHDGRIAKLGLTREILPNLGPQQLRQAAP